MVCAVDDDFPAALLLRDFREGKQLQLAPLLAGLMVEAARRAWSEALPSVWVPLPLSKAQVLQVGFSPTQQLTQAVSRQTNIDWHLHWLRLANPHSDSDPDHDLDPAAFEYKATSDVTGLTVGLVTDVVETDATIGAAAKALLVAGAMSVMVLAAGRTPKARESGTIAPCSM